MGIIIDYGTTPKQFETHLSGLTICNIKESGYLYLGQWKPLMDIPVFRTENGEHILEQLSKKIISDHLDDYLCLGEMTNLAALLLLYPEIEQKIRRIIICPGEKDKTSEYPVSEKNVLQDPISAKVVMRSLPLKVIAEQETPAKQYAAANTYLSKPYKKEDPQLYASVQTEKGCTYGSLYIDKWNICKKAPNAILI